MKYEISLTRRELDVLRWSLETAEKAVDRMIVARALDEDVDKVRLLEASLDVMGDLYDRLTAARDAA